MFRGGRGRQRLGERIRGAASRRRGCGARASRGRTNTRFDLSETAGAREADFRVERLGLPERTREIFLMHRIDKLEYSEIAQRLGISESAIEKQMAKAMVALADYAKAW